LGNLHAIVRAGHGRGCLEENHRLLTRAGFKHFTVKPSIPSRLDHAETTLESPYVTVTAGWKKDGGALIMNLTIPANSSASLQAPANTKPESLLINGQAPESLPEVKIIAHAGRSPILELPSGTYSVRAEIE
jgi:alpha-L-rhamnosidase